MSRSGLFRGSVLVCLFWVGCGDPVPVPPGEMDAGGTLDAPSPTTDAPSRPLCVVDDDCDDDLYCSGVERCRPMATDADGRGCVAGTPPCATGETCAETTDTCDGGCADTDLDGHGAVSCGGDDCDDTDPLRHPGAVEVCDSTAHDEDCNLETFGFLDADSDGVGSYVCCNTQLDSTLACGTDCNDGDGMVNPRAGDGPPLFCDGVDNDCSGTSDEGCPCVEGDTQECGTAAQLGRIGLCRPGSQVCSGGAFTEACIGAISPGEEICDGLDNDCDAMIDESVLRRYHDDVDGDGYGAVGSTPIEACSAPPGHASNATDCDDAVASVNPGATEVCNGRDDNCFMGVDEGFIGTWYADDDGDGFGDAATSTMSCAPPTGHVRVGTDCDDTRNGVNPGAPEVCDGIDNDCDTMVDDGVTRTYYRDADNDGFGVMGTTTTACAPPSGYTDRIGDCDDAIAAVSPAAAEVCNGRDDNCAGGTDEGVLRTYYRDADGDSFGLLTSTMTACAAPAGHTDRPGDCDDAASGRNPSAADACDGVDNNCDGTTDPGCTCTDGTTRSCGATDTGECTFGTQTCVGGSWGGCIGSIASTAESCNGLDDDCDGTLDNGVTTSGCYRDGDGDAYGTGGTTTQCRDASRSAFGFCPVGWVNNNGDCNDGVSAIRPGATETCNGIDDDCDATADDGTTAAGCLADADADGYGTGVPTTLCRDAARSAFGFCPVGYTNVAGDCNDGAAGVRPGATETCNTTDDDCDGMTDDGVSATPCYADADADGRGIGAPTTQCRDAARAAFGFCPVSYSNLTGDCNDANSAVRPGAVETCNGIDDDCSGAADNGFFCVRGATRTGSGAFGSCASIGGTFTCNTTCTAETFTPIIPPESCDGTDEDCDGAADDTFACVRASSGNACTTACGTPGTHTCTGSCTAGTCRGTETCNGCDDDADGMRDEGLGAGGSTVCYLGESRACTTSCGTAGTQYCLSDCRGWDACRAASETCNGCDDDVDGTPDEGFACAASSITPCLTACGTAGVRVCSAMCTQTMAECGSTFEYCNYCDDDRDGDWYDDEPYATGTAVYTPTGCSSGGALVYGTASCGTDTSCRTFVSEMFRPGQLAPLADAFSEAGTVWLSQPVRLGWGPMTVTITTDVQPIVAGEYPAYGWTAMFTTDTAATAGAFATFGVPATMADGYLVEWRYYDGSVATEADRVTFAEFGTGGTRTGLGIGFNPDPVYHHDRADAGVTVQTLTIEITPDNPNTLPNESMMQVRDQSGGSAWDFSWTTFSNPLRAGDLVRIGIAGATTASNRANIRARIGNSAPGAGSMFTGMLCFNRSAALTSLVCD